MLNLKERIDILSSLGDRLAQPDLLPAELLVKVRNTNPWFIEENVKKSMAAVADNYLNKSLLEKWTSDYDFSSVKSQNIGLILAGNIPLVGIHDLISCFVAGHKSIVKLSDKDSLLLPYIFDLLVEISPDTEPYFKVVERLKDYDAVIATGSDTSKGYFQKYFGKVPHLIRGNRNGVAIVYQDSTPQDLTNLGLDIFSYFGLGCRNVSKLYLEKGVELKQIFVPFEKFFDIIHHHKYKNNYDYNNALYLLNSEEYFTNDCLILRPHQSLNSRIAAVHYEYFDTPESLVEILNSQADQIQCIVSDRGLYDKKIFGFGQSQSPALDDYADDTDTLAFLLNLND